MNSLFFWFLCFVGCVAMTQLPSLTVGFGGNLVGLWAWDLVLDCSQVSYFICMMLAFCGAMVLAFCDHYFGYVNTALKQLITLFLGVMTFLSISGDYLMGLIFWEYLGFVSFVLMLFYAKFDTFRAGVMTLVTSRVGDVGLFLLCGYWLVSFGGEWVVALCCLAVMATKSALFPVGSWLLEAMRAPTPVSCLVHSSTLVAAGMWFLTQFSHSISGLLQGWLICLALATVLMSGGCAMWFSDVKKMVALSTCNKISWCMIYFCVGDTTLCLMQLLCHGIAKCLLFMGVGDILAGSYSSQNMKALHPTHYASATTWVFNMILIFCLAGGPFNGVYFTKHLLATNPLSNFKSLVLALMLVGFLCTYTYSTRLLVIMTSPTSKTNSLVKAFNAGSIFLTTSGLLKYYLCSHLVEGDSMLGVIAAVVLVLQATGLVLGLVLGNQHRNAWSASVMGQDFLVTQLYTRWVGWVTSLTPMAVFRWEVAMATSVSLNHSLVGLGVVSTPLLVLAMCVLQ